MNTVEKGNLAEAIAIKEMMKLGYDILTPFGHHLPFDFVAHKNGELLKIQVKGKDSSKGRITDIKLKRNPFNNFKGIKQKMYESGDWDWMLVVDLKTEKVYRLTFDDFGSSINLTLRTEQPKNGQLKGINLAEDYLLSA